jgi:hypothetical protein
MIRSFYTVSDEFKAERGKIYSLLSSVSSRPVASSFRSEITTPADPGIPSPVNGSYVFASFSFYCQHSKSLTALGHRKFSQYHDLQGSHLSLIRRVSNFGRPPTRTR